MDNLYGRRTNSNNKLSLSTQNGSASAGFGDSPISSRTATFPKRFGGDSSSHGKLNPFNNATTPGGPNRIMSPTGASSAFGLGSGAFSSFGGAAKTPKSSGNPFDLGAKTASSFIGTSAAASTSSLTGEKSVSTTPRPAASAGPVAATGATSTDAAKADASLGGSGKKFPLRGQWVFWFRPPISKANGYIEYEKTLHPVANVSTVPEFFSVYQHLQRPSKLPLVSDYHLFRKGIRPIWEDDENRKGGKWVVRLKKGVADRLWEDLLYAIIGEQFMEASDEVCGAVLSVRNGEDILSIWTRTVGGRVLKIRESMKRELNLPANTKVEWKSHDSSIQQRSVIEESRREKPNNHHHHHHNDRSSGNGGGGSHQHHNAHHNHSQHQTDRRPGKPALSLSGGEEPTGNIRSTP